MPRKPSDSAFSLAAMSRLLEKPCGVCTAQSVERLTFIKCAQQLGFKLKELQEILLGYNGDALPWDRADQAIANKKRALAAQIAVLQRMQAGLIEFETQLKDAQGHCSSISNLAI